MTREVDPRLATAAVLANTVLMVGGFYFGVHDAFLFGAGGYISLFLLGSAAYLHERPTPATTGGEPDAE